MIRTVVVAGEPLPYEWTAKKVKNVNLRVRGDGTVAVSSPRGMPSARVDDFVIEKAAWIRRAQARAAQRQSPAGPADGGRFLLLGEERKLTVEAGTPPRVEETSDGLRLVAEDPADAERLQALLRAYGEQAGAPALERALVEAMRLAAPLEIPRPQVRMRWMRSRWGSCSYTRGTITLNWALTALPPDLITYVVLHELVHFRHPDHSPAFHACMASLMPGAAMRRKRLAAYTPTTRWFR